MNRRTIVQGATPIAAALLLAVAPVRAQSNIAAQPDAKASNPGTVRAEVDPRAVASIPDPLNGRAGSDFARGADRSRRLPDVDPDPGQTWLIGGGALAALLLTAGGLVLTLRLFLQDRRRRRHSYRRRSAARDGGTDSPVSRHPA